MSEQQPDRSPRDTKPRYELYQVAEDRRTFPDASGRDTTVYYAIYRDWCDVREYVLLDRIMFEQLIDQLAEARGAAGRTRLSQHVPMPSYGPAEMAEREAADGALIRAIRTRLGMDDD